MYIVHARILPPLCSYIPNSMQLCVALILRALFLILRYPYIPKWMHRSRKIACRIRGLHDMSVPIKLKISPNYNKVLVRQRYLDAND